MSGNMWYGLLRFLNLLDDLTTYFSIQLGRCVLLSFPVLALILILRRGVFMKTTFLKGMVWGIFSVVPFLGKLICFMTDHGCRGCTCGGTISVWYAGRSDMAICWVSLSMQG